MPMIIFLLPVKTGMDEDGAIRTGGIQIMDVSYAMVSSEGPGGVDCMLVRFDGMGNRVWEREYYEGPWTDLAAEECAPEPVILISGY